MFGKRPDPALEQARAELARVYDLLRDERARNDALVQEIVKLRRDGFMQPAPAATVPDEPRKVGGDEDANVDAVIEHYAEMAPNPAQARRTLQTYAIRLRAIGKKPEEIMAAIHRGDPSTGDDDE